MTRRTPLVPRRRLAFLALALATAFSLVAGAQTKKAPAAKRPKTAAPANQPSPSEADGGVDPPRAAEGAATPADQASGASEQKTLDGGTRVFRFDEVEVEGRLKSPQIVYFLRRVRAELATTDLGHRSFMGELAETKREPGF